MKRILTSSFIILTSYFVLHGSARADLLYFMVSAYDPEGAKTFDFARVGVATASGQVIDGTSGKPVYLALVENVGGTEGSAWVEAAGRYTAGPAWASLGDYAADGYSFYIETWNTQGDADVQIWGYSPETAVAFSSLVLQNHVYSQGTALQTITPWNVPEPTSGMLALLGCALLALRRKRERQFRV